jgi:hypothetical protein
MEHTEQKTVPEEAQFLDGNREASRNGAKSRQTDRCGLCGELGHRRTNKLCPMRVDVSMSAQAQIASAPSLVLPDNADLSAELSNDVPDIDYGSSDSDSGSDGSPKDVPGLVDLSEDELEEETSVQLRQNAERPASSAASRDSWTPHQLKAVEDVDDTEGKLYDPELPFSDRHVGVNVVRFPVDLSPMKIMMELLTFRLEHKLLNATNQFGAMHYGSGWKRLFRMELFAFIAVIIYMGIVRRDSKADYWKEGLFRDPFVTAVFPKQERFDQIMF